MVTSTNTNQPPATTLTRREALTYGFGASLALLLAGSCGGLVWFLQKPAADILHDEDHGYFSLDLANLPQPDKTPVSLRNVRCWMVQTGDSLLALYAVSPDDGCLLKWSESNHRFENPCHGTKFQLDGTYIEGSSVRSMDRFLLSVTTAHGTFTTPADGSPVPIEGATSITLNVNLLIPGKPRYPNSLGT